RESSRASKIVSIGGLLTLGVIGILIIGCQNRDFCQNQVFMWYFAVVGALILLVLIIQSCRQQLRVRTAMRMFVLLIHLLAIWLGYDWFMKATSTLASGNPIEVTVTSIGAQDRKIQVALPPVPDIKLEKLGPSSQATFIVPVAATVTSV